MAIKRFETQDGIKVQADDTLIVASSIDSEDSHALAIKTRYMGFIGQKIDLSNDGYLGIQNYAEPVTGTTFTSADWDTATWDGTQVNIINAGSLLAYLNGLNGLKSFRINGEYLLAGSGYASGGDNVFLSGMPDSGTPTTVTEIIVYQQQSAMVGLDGTDNSVFITAENKQWKFAADGTLTLPGGTDITVPASYDIQRQGKDIRIVGQRGYGNWSTNNVAGYGGDGSSILLTAGRGGESSDPDQGGEGGAIDLRSGVGQAGNNGGTIRIIGGNAEYNNSTNSVQGGNIEITAGNATYNVGASGLGVGGNVTIQAGNGNASGQYGRVSIITDGDLWEFGQDGTLGTASGSWTKTTNNNLIDNVTTQVVWTSRLTNISGAKLTIQVECRETGGVNYPAWETQVCEAVVATRGYNSTSIPVVSVYGVTHTSVAPLMTFSVQRNPTTFLIEIVGTRTGTAVLLNNADLKIYSVETGTND